MWFCSPEALSWLSCDATNLSRTLQSISSSAACAVLLHLLPCGEIICRWPPRSTVSSSPMGKGMWRELPGLTSLGILGLSNWGSSRKASWRRCWWNSVSRLREGYAWWLYWATGELRSVGKWKWSSNQQGGSCSFPLLVAGIRFLNTRHTTHPSSWNIDEHISSCDHIISRKVKSCVFEYLSLRGVHREERKIICGSTWLIRMEIVGVLRVFKASHPSRRGKFDQICLVISFFILTGDEEESN